MWAEVTPLRQEGKVNPRWKHGADLCIGRLQVMEQHDRAVRRWVRTAVLHTHDRLELLPPLRDVMLLQLEGQYFVLGGYEHKYITGAEEPALVGQAWAIHAVDEALYRSWRARQDAEGRLKRLRPAP